ncbi:putative leader peptide [Streptomyces sp. NPDC048045]|uniref:putative leader peptide n=1 Tax=Streptomyces sp. NPDC048045 TaxID=3154710 RepID=UPI00343EB1AB
MAVAAAAVAHVATVCGATAHAAEAWILRSRRGACGTGAERAAVEEIARQWSRAYGSGADRAAVREHPAPPARFDCDEIRQAGADRARRARATEVTAVIRVHSLRVPQPYRSVRLHSRPHIDLQRVAGALCRP